MNEIKFKKYTTRGSYHWDQISKSFKRRNIYIVARYQLILKLIKEEIHHNNILDLGCGDGVLSYLLAKKGAEVKGIDNSEEAIKIAKQKCRDMKNVEFLLASAYELPFSDNNFEFVVVSEVLEHLKYPESALSEIKRVWNKKGKIMISTPIKFTEEPLDAMHYKEFFEGEFRTLLEKYFQDITIVKSHPMFWTEFQNKLILGRSLNKFLLNCLNLFLGFSPFQNTTRWRYYTLQTAIISK